MKKWQDIKLDDESMWPKEGLVELDSPHTDIEVYTESCKLSYEKYFINFIKKGFYTFKSLSSYGLALYVRFVRFF